MKPRYISAAFLAGVMMIQALLGLLRPDQYRDEEWVRATWFGNDSVTLVVAVPLLIVASVRAAGGSGRALLLTLGLSAYAIYNDAFYLFGAALNAFFPIYVVLLVVAVGTFVDLIRALDATGLAINRLNSQRVAGGYFAAVAVGLTVSWLSVWAAYVFFGRATPIAPDAFRLVAALDLALMVPLLSVGGVLLWRQRAWGVVISGIAGVLATMYLLVLVVNSVVAIRRGLTAAPGELPLWGILFALTAIATVSVFAQVVRLKADRTSVVRLQANTTSADTTPVDATSVLR